MTELTIDQALQEAVKAHKDGKIQDADRLYTAILKAQPKHADANHNLGVLAVGIGKVQEALPLLKTALDANPSIAQFWISYIDALIKLDRAADAQTVFILAKSRGARGDRFDKLAEKLALTEQPFNVAEAPLKEAPKRLNLLDKLKLDQALRLAKNKAKEGLTHEARYIYEDIRTKFPNNKRAIEGLKSLNSKKTTNNLDIQDPPQNQLQSLINLYTKGDLNKALEKSNQLIAKFPRSAVLFNIQGALLKTVGQLDLSLEAYKKAISIKPDYSDAYYNLGVNLQAQGQFNQAIEYYNQTLSIKPDYAEAYNNIGNALKALGKPAEAIVYYNKALFIKPDYAEAYYNIGNALKELGKPAEALNAYKKAISIKPEYVEAHNNMGSALKELGKLDKAIISFENALSNNPDYAEAYYNLGIALNAQGKQKEAIVAYNKALSIKPDYDEARHMVAALSGETTNSAPRTYVENLFDEYAAKFDHSLLDNLSYGLPEIVTQLALEKNGSETLGSILDLGCGTGLTGSKIKPFCTYLEGIDLSNKMLEMAKTKHVYDKLGHFDILEYLSNTELDFDYIISTDVFVYLGELSEVFRLIKSKNKKHGKLIFSTEHNEKDGFHLLETGRYTHSLKYIEGLCREYEFFLSHFSKINLRKENGIFLIGGLYLLEF